jgi:hypothetical protein
MDCPTSRFNGPELALLAPAAERERSPHSDSDQRYPIADTSIRHESALTGGVPLELASLCSS